MSDELKSLFQSIGALSELLGVLKDEFIKNGFTREESVYLVGVILKSVVASRNGPDIDGDMSGGTDRSAK